MKANQSESVVGSNPIDEHLYSAKARESKLENT